MVEPTSDEALVLEYKQGNAHAFRLLVERYTAPIYNLACRFVRDPMEAENVTQETFLRVVLSLDRIRLDEPFKPYLFRIAVNLCRDLARKKQPALFADLTRVDETDPSDSMIDGALELWESLAEEELQKRVRQAIRELPPHYQLVIDLRYVEDFSYAEIAQTLDLPLNTVRTHLRRAKQQLERAIAREWHPSQEE